MDERVLPGLQIEPRLPGMQTAREIFCMKAEARPRNQRHPTGLPGNRSVPLDELRVAKIEDHTTCGNLLVQLLAPERGKPLARRSVRASLLPQLLRWAGLLPVDCSKSVYPSVRPAAGICSTGRPTLTMGNNSAQERASCARASTGGDAPLQ